MFYIVERIPLAKEPPLDERCRDQFLVEITAVIPAREDLRDSAYDIVGIPFFLLFLNVQVVSFFTSMKVPQTMIEASCFISLM